MKQFQGRVICPGTCEAEALVSHGGFNTLASYQMALMFHDKQVKCGDQNNPDLYKKPMIGKALCLPETIGSTTGGMVLYTACASGQQPACMLFSKHIDSLAASGAILASVWTDADMPVIDCLGDEFLAAVQTGQTVRTNEVVFTRGTTESINLLVSSFGDEFMEEGDEVILSVMEHHSNIVPWQLLAARKGIAIKVIPMNDKGELLLDEYEKLFSERTKIVSGPIKAGRFSFAQNSQNSVTY